MIILLSPAKTLDYETPSINISHTIPNLLSNSKKLIKNLKEKKPEEISNLMNISDKLASLNSDRYKSWKGLKEKSENSKQAIFVFKGDVYQGLDIDSFGKKILNILKIIFDYYLAYMVC